MLTGQQQIDEIYKVYPRKVAPRAAKKAIENAVKRIVMNGSSEEGARRWLWKKAKEYALSPAGQKPQDRTQDFRPHPSTWFNQERYLDDPAEWQRPNGGKNGKQSTTASAEQIARANARVAELSGNPLRAR